MSIRARLSVVGEKLNGLFRRPAGWILLGAGAMALLAALGQLPRAGAQQPVQTELSPGVLRQLASLYQEQQARTPVQRKLDSQLVYRLRMRRTGRVTTEVPALRVGGRIDANEKVLLDLSATVSDELLQQIRDWGGEVINHFAQYDSIRAWLPLDSLESLASRAEVRFVRPADEGRPHSMAGDSRDEQGPGPAPLAPASRVARGERIRRQLTAEIARRQRLPGMPLSPAAVLVGSLTSQGDRTHQADAARTNYGVNGTGIRIGVLSDSVNTLGGAAADIVNGDLPGAGNPNGFTTPVTVLQEGIGADEGRSARSPSRDAAGDR